jgi:hypothetical protein
MVPIFARNTLLGGAILVNCPENERTTRRMLKARRSIFRSEALEHYIQNREKNILPRITTPPVFLCMWILLGLCITAIAVACLGQVPVYVSGSGIVLEPDAIQKTQQNHGITVLVFLPASSVHPLWVSVGAPARLRVGVSSQTVSSTIYRVEPGTLSPSDAQKRFGFGNRVSQIIPGPSIVVFIQLGATFPSQIYAGSIVNAQVQIGTTRVLSMLLGTATSSGE